MTNQPFIAETTFYVRFAETDAMGIVHHSNYLVYFEEGRSDLSRQVGAPYADLEAEGYSLTVTEAELRFVAPARYNDQVTVRTWVEEVKSRGLSFAYELVNTATGRRLVTARTGHICIDHTGQIKRLPEKWAAVFKQIATKE